MFGVSDIIDNTDNAINYYELYDDLLKCDDFNILNYDDKLNRAMIYLYNKNDKTNEEIEILNKYNDYILNKIRDNSFNIINNLYFRTIFSIEYQKNSDYVLDINIDELIDKFNNCLESIEKKINNDINLSGLERDFYQNSLIFVAANSIIDSSDIDIIVKYFNKYPVSNLKDTDNRKLYLINMISKSIKDIGGSVCISFNKQLEISNGNVTFGHFGKMDDGRYLLMINNINDYNISYDRDFYEVIFTVLHELGHLNQDINYDKYSEHVRKRIDIEKYIINNDKEFYDNNHDNFFVEVDANMYAIKRILSEFNNKETLSICKKKINKLGKVYNDDKFVKLER